MENESYSEYFQKRNKVSLVMWMLINNNIVTRNIYIVLMSFEFTFNFVMILCLYNEVNSVPILSESLVKALDFDDSYLLSIIEIC
jgi:hypothetical protein